MFEKASRMKLRFDTTQGQFSVEELWDLNLQSLDNIAKAVNKQLRNETEESFIPTIATRKAATHNDLKLDILKHIIAVRVQETDEKKAKNDKLAHLERLKNLQLTKQDEQLASKSLDEINKEIAELQTALV